MISRTPYPGLADLYESTDHNLRTINLGLSTFEELAPARASRTLLSKEIQ